VAILLACLLTVSLRAEDKRPFRLAAFHTDVTIPLNHRCMGILPTKSQQIVDPLEVHGFVLLGADKPIVLAAVDWCEIRNGAYEQWRTALAEAAGTTADRVLVSSLHQHDAPVVDREAQEMLNANGMINELYDVQFHERCLRDVAKAVAESLPHAVPVTHVATGQARVEQVASNRRVVTSDGQVTFNRGSRSAGDPALRDAAEGEIDPYLKTLSFWNGEQAILALHAYATHPMSYYGQGGVSADFVGLARRLRSQDDPNVAQIYVSGCSGDVTAGKYNDGSPAMRGALADRLYQAMKSAWQTSDRAELTSVELRTTTLELPFRDDPQLKRDVLKATLEDKEADERDRILAAMALSSLNRVEAGKPIDVSCIDFGSAQLVLLPGESFVGYQLLAQKLRGDKFVVTIGYGECWPGYIPTDAAFADHFTDVWLWVNPGCESRMKAALLRVMK
jgi:hypothetical protein